MIYILLAERVVAYAGDVAIRYVAGSKEWHVRNNADLDTDGRGHLIGRWGQIRGYVECQCSTPSPPVCRICRTHEDAYGQGSNKEER